MNSLFSDWSPPSERSRHSTIAFGGAQLGTIVALPIGGLLCQYVSWDSVFYVFGVLGIVWFALWMYLVSNSPATCRFIKSEEKVGIIASQYWSFRKNKFESNDDASWGKEEEAAAALFSFKEMMLARF